jgi:hypothetical protein
MKHPNIYGKPRTLDELREEHNVIARLHSQTALAFPEGHPQLVSVGRKLDRARDALRRAMAQEKAD